MALFCLHIYFFSQFLIWSLDHYVMSSLSLITVFVLPSVCLMKVLPFQLWFPFVWNTLTQWKRIHLTMLESQKLQVWSLSQEDPLEEEMAPHFSILAKIISWTEEPGRLQSVGSQRVRYNWAHTTYNLFPHAFNLYMPLDLKWISPRQYTYIYIHICMYGSCIYINSVMLCFLIGAFSLFTFKVIIHVCTYCQFVHCLGTIL